MTEPKTNEPHEYDELKKMIDSVEAGGDSITDDVIGQQSNEARHEQTVEMDVLNLPPRSETHGNEKKRIHVKFSLPLLRLLLIVVILIVLLGCLYYFWGDDILNLVVNASVWNCSSVFMLLL